jgi:predicted HicB family RNase H-like nuclease
MSNKDLQYYKGLAYNIVVEKQEMDGETWFIAFTNELGKFACYGRGETQIEALNSFMEEKEAFIEYLFNKGETIPEPKIEDEEKFSGFFNVRTSSIIHAKLVHQAKELDISLNLYVNQILAASVESNRIENIIMNKLGEICGKIDFHHFEVTRQLRFQNENLNKSLTWPAEYGNHPYLEVA